MLRLSKMTDYAVVVLTTLAHADGALHTANSLADRTGLPMPTVQKLLKLLARGDLLQSHRGAMGGYSLSRTPDRINVVHIIEAIEGPIALTDCVDGGSGSCGVQSLCSRKGHWEKVNGAVRRALEDVTLADMATPNLFDFDQPPPARRAALAG
ncbi:SUF system Fe-S cluster assembly regulator [Niveispirillum fermenti]|uniref:SUF system Fe-S cluster assembly regulator n=1 Tax=Niveispirillum fermenti TaxID=1233113 RepID=UPI003A8A960A